MSRTARRPSSPSSRSEIYSPQSISRTSWGCATAPSSGCSPTPAPGASARLRQGDFQDHGPQRVFRSREKGGKEREIPVGLEFPILLVNPGSGSAKAAFVWRQQGDVSPFLGKIVRIPLSGVFGRRWRLTGDPRFRRPSWGAAAAVVPGHCPKIGSQRLARGSDWGSSQRQMTAILVVQDETPGAARRTHVASRRVSSLGSAPKAAPSVATRGR